MKTERRFFLASFTAALAGATALVAAGQRQVPSTQIPPPFPDTRGPDNSPDELPPPAPDPKLQLKESQKNLKRDADHLLELAKELKDQVDNTEQTKVLSLSLVHKAEEVEKLARQIKDLVREA